jgi:hypothetical protein
VSWLLSGNDWRIHPDWVYCLYNYAGENNREFDHPEDNLLHFLARMKQRGWNWGAPWVRPLPKCSNSEQYDHCIKCE